MTEAAPGWWSPSRLLRANAMREAGRADLVISNNDETARALKLAGVQTELEPNVIAEPTGAECATEEDLLSMVGLLIDRKRPWLAIQALADRRLARYRLQIIGDGPLAPQLKSLVQQERLESRVQFLGRLPRDDAMRRLSRSRLLLHPSSREGSPWAVGEAAALGIPSVVFAGTGADTTARLSANGSHICRSDAHDLAGILAEGASSVLLQEKQEPSDRWSSSRLPSLLESWWHP